METPDTLTAAPPPAGDGAPAVPPPPARTPLSTWLFRAGWLCVIAALVSVTAPVCGQERPPRPLPAKEVKFPPYQIRTLDNGLRVVVVSQNEQPAVSLRLLVRAGAAQNPPDKAGLASMVGALLDQGIPGQSSSEIADAIDYIGGALGAGAGTDLAFVNALVLTTYFDQALDLVSKVARTPTFPQEELDRIQEQAASAMQVNMQDPDYLADVAIDRLIYGFHPYGLPSTGTPASVAALTREDIVRFHDTWYAPNNAILAVVGDVAPDAAFAAVERVFGDWPRKDVPAVDPGTMPAPTRRVVLIDRPGAVQTEIRAGIIGIPRKHDDFMAVNLATKILGGEGANRLQNVLRSERGLTYGASADMDAFKLGGAIVAQTDTQTSTTGEALRLMIDEFARMPRSAVGQRELAGAQAYLSGSFPLGLETADEIALQVLNVLFYDLDVRDLETYPDRVNAVTSDDVLRVAKQFIVPDRLSIVLVGDARAVLPQLERVGFEQVEVVPIADVDLASVTLRRRSADAAR